MEVEMVFAYSYKEDKTADMPRSLHKRGRAIKKYGISNEQICVGIALNR